MKTRLLKTTSALYSITENENTLFENYFGSVMDL